ncbi:MAG: GNAT family N-acetyltransferase [Verrucomicrobiaceae bacterium]
MVVLRLAGMESKSNVIEMERHENNREHLESFIRLNEEWIRTYFSLEETDHKLAADPGKIIDEGGFVFSLAEGGEVVGVCALFCEGEGVFELARMAVSPGCQGRGIGDQLMTVCLAKAREVGAKKVYLVSNTKLEAAIQLYLKYGFVATHTGPHPLYSRANIVMELKG